jgi:glycerol-1-phosphatase
MTAPIDRYDRFVFDLDGTVWRGTTLLPHAAEVLAEIRRRGHPVAFLTNNGARSGREVAELLQRMGIEAAPEHIVTSGRAARRLLEDRGLAGRSCFLVGGEGLREELEPIGLRFLSEDEGERAEVVVVTRDERFTYGRLRAASRAIARGAFFAATNPDPTFPVEDGFWPGGGSIVAAVQAASGGAEPSFAGKPERPMLEEAETAVGGRGGRTLMVGDRPASDLESARRMGWDGALVLTGVTGDPGPIDPPPDLLLRDLSDLLAG